MRFKEIERRLLEDGWRLYAQRGSHCQYVHPEKPGKVTVPKHNGDINPRTVASIWKQAGISERRTK
ncbi:MAG: type II toxin-antitoxin system HicA family toxin [Bifidobacterium pseudocatenulatum]|nr:type II toxin-antitoxin system HicA family toxin [Bifidobacterium catenulatum]